MAVVSYLDFNGLVLGVGVPVAVEAVAVRDLPNFGARHQIFEFLMKIRFIVGHGEHDNA